MTNTGEQKFFLSELVGHVRTVTPAVNSSYSVNFDYEEDEFNIDDQDDDDL
jgi:hypothetical protein